MTRLTRRWAVAEWAKPGAVRVCAAALVLACLAGPLAAQARAAGDLKVYGGDINDQAELDPGGRCEITITGTRNGTFSGKVIATSGQPIEGLKALMSDLKQDGATIPSSAATVRYAVGWEESIGNWHRPPGRDILLKSPPEGQTTVPVWVTVAVPKEAKAGSYTGQLAIAATGAQPIRIPVTLKVQDWTLPDPQNYRTWIEMVQSPDTLASEYDVPLWSDKHWAMIAQSMRLMSGTGTRTVYVPLIAETNMGNSESMVRWVKKGGGFEPDFSAMDRYLDTAVENMGKPKQVIFYAWDVFVAPPDEDFMKRQRDNKSYELEKFEARVAEGRKGVPVTIVDPATGKTTKGFLPHYDSPEGKAVWGPFWKQLRQRMAKRGLDKAMMLGVASDWRPSKSQLTALKEFTGDLPWTSASHHARWLFGTKKDGSRELEGVASVGYTAVALDFQYTINPANGRCYGWQKEMLHAQYWRFQYFNTQSMVTIRGEAEANITGNQRGLARVGADFWFTIKDKRGRRVGTVTDRYPQSYWHSMNVTAWLLAPGPDGPVGTARLETFTEGIQECEARIAIELALTDNALRNKLGKDLAEKAQKILDERLVALWKGRGADDAAMEHGLVPAYRDMYAMRKEWDAKAGNAWFVASGWQDRNAQLYTVAGEVTAKLGGR
ncbi:MAG: hypothetical protein JXL80_15225 [Planctomycetes bacterium]|nr:hypothetical protein [Planctomycetota bacterium]